MKAVLEEETKEKKNRKVKEEEEERRKRDNLILQRNDVQLDLDKLFRVTEALMNKLTPMELFRLS